MSPTHRYLRGTLFLIHAVLCALPVLAEMPTAEYIFPPGGQAGQTVTGTVTGSFSNWPVQVWTSSEHLKLSPLEEKGQFEIAIADQAASGIYWWRLYDKEGASSPRPFIVDSLPEVIEDEANDSTKPQVVSLPAIVNGRLEKRGDVDAYQIQIEKGETLVATVVANHYLQSPMDAVMQLCTPDGFVIQQNHDAIGLDPQIVYTADTGSDFLIRLFAFPSKPNSTIAFAGAANYLYRLTLTTGPVVDHALPRAAAAHQETEFQLQGWNFLEPLPVVLSQSSQREMATVSHPRAAGFFRCPVLNVPLADGASPKLAVPACVSRELLDAGHLERLMFLASKGQKLELSVDARSFGSPLDAMLTVRKPDGAILAEADDRKTGFTHDPQLVQTFPADGLYSAEVKDLHDRFGRRFAYRLVIREVAADFRLTVAEDAYVMPAAGTFDIPVAVERLEGYSEAIAITAVDLPASLEAAVVESAATGDTAKSVMLKITAKEPWSGPIRIRGRSTNDNGLERTATFALEPHDDIASLIWLTASAADQGEPQATSAP